MSRALLPSGLMVLLSRRHGNRVLGLLFLAGEGQVQRRSGRSDLPVETSDVLRPSGLLLGQAVETALRGLKPAVRLRGQVRLVRLRRQTLG